MVEIQPKASALFSTSSEFAVFFFLNSLSCQIIRQANKIIIIIVNMCDKIASHSINILFRSDLALHLSHGHV